MNPFDLYGPYFLGFYALLAALVIGGLVLVRKRMESGPSPQLELSDPYLIAYLRGGKNEVLRVAIVSMVDRKVLTAEGTQIKTRIKAPLSVLRHPVEQILADKFAQRNEANSVFADSELEKACELYRERLERAGLLPDAATQSLRIAFVVVALAILIGVAVTKILIGLSRERPVLFLIIAGIIAVVITLKVFSPRLTARGQATLEDIQSLYAGLKERASMVRGGGATAEAVMLAAVFGITALQTDAFAYTRTLFPQAASSSGSSSCGSSCSSSCGSSCGGGGCGGGCGGCGS